MAIPTADIVPYTEKFLVADVSGRVCGTKTFIDAVAIWICVNIRIQRGGFREAGVAQINAGINDTDDRARAFGANR